MLIIMFLTVRPWNAMLGSIMEWENKPLSVYIAGCFSFMDLFFCVSGMNTITFCVQIVHILKMNFYVHLLTV